MGVVDWFVSHRLQQVRMQAGLHQKAQLIWSDCNKPGWTTARSIDGEEGAAECFREAAGGSNRGIGHIEADCVTAGIDPGHLGKECCWWRRRIGKVLPCKVAWHRRQREYDAVEGCSVAVADDRVGPVDPERLGQGRIRRVDNVEILRRIRAAADGGKQQSCTEGRTDIPHRLSPPWTVIGVSGRFVQTARLAVPEQMPDPRHSRRQLPFGTVLEQVSERLNHREMRGHATSSENEGF